MKRFLPFAALVFAVGCNSAVTVVPPTFKETAGTPGTSTVATVREGGVVKLTSENTKITFVGTKPGGKHDGGFGKVDGNIKMSNLSPGQIPPPDWAKIESLKVEIDADSLTSDDPKLTGHLKQADFFDVKKFPTATFTSTKVTGERDKTEDAIVTGDLTLHGVTKSITFPVHFTTEKGSFVLTSSFKISRKDFGMTFGSDGKIDDAVAINVTIGEVKK